MELKGIMRRCLERSKRKGDIFLMVPVDVVAKIGKAVSCLLQFLAACTTGASISFTFGHREEKLGELSARITGHIDDRGKGSRELQSMTNHGV